MCTMSTLIITMFFLIPLSLSLSLNLQLGWPPEICLSLSPTSDVFPMMELEGRVWQCLAFHMGLEGHSYLLSHLSNCQAHRFCWAYFPSLNKKHQFFCCFSLHSESQLSGLLSGHPATREILLSGCDHWLSAAARTHWTPGTGQEVTSASFSSGEVTYSSIYESKP